MSFFKCKMCGGTIEFEQGATVGVCDSCGTKQTLPRLDDDRRVNLYDRANHFRRNNEFDKAAGIYEQILNEDKTDAEAYWSLVLCRYGIEYVEDPATRRRVPTVNRAQFTSIFDDDNYKSALQYADTLQKGIYESEAKAINEIQKGILAISQKEEPFDVFICYKETDANGRRTPDSVLANDLYHQLTQEGFKVFFSRITLEDKLGTAYEPYIFAALNSAKVMVVLGTKPEHFNAVWVKNEWSRYLALVKQSGGRKVLIPAYKDMDPYDLPEEFSHLQAQDMSKLGFMQDLIRGIKKIVTAAVPKQPVKEPAAAGSGSASVAPLLKRAFMFLEDGEWQQADEYCEKVLDQDPENAQAYLGKLMAELNVRKQEGLADCAQPFDSRNNYQKAVRFGDQALTSALNGYITHINERNENARLTGIYNKGVSAMNAANTEDACRAAASIFVSIKGFRDSAALVQQCYSKAETCRKDAIYATATAKMARANIGDLKNAIKVFQSIPGWRDTDEQIVACQKKIDELTKEAEQKAEAQRIAAKKRKKILLIAAAVIAVIVAFAIILITVIIPNSKYNDAMELYEEGRYREAAVAFGKLGSYSDARERSFTLWAEIAERQTISADDHTVGLKADGTVVAAGEGSKCYVSGWTDIVAISAGGDHTVGLKADGTVVSTGSNDHGQCDVSDWTDIVAISAGGDHTVGLKADGTVVATKYTGDQKYYCGQCDVSDWTGIVAISAASSHTVGLKADGTVVATKYTRDQKYYSGQCDVSGWTDIVAISAGGDHTVGLKADGTVVATRFTGDKLFNDGQCNVTGWTDIVAISADDHTVGLKADGTVVSAGSNYGGQCDVSDWTDIVAISAGYIHTVGLKADGTVVATRFTGDKFFNHGQCNVTGWKDIKQPK